MLNPDETKRIAAPSLAGYTSIGAFIQARLEWRRATESGFSLRAAASRAGMSHSQLSRLASGKRQVTREFVESLAKVLRLSGRERAQLDRWVATCRTPAAVASPRTLAGATARLPRGEAKNLLHDWLNVYVRDASKLRSFKPDPVYLHRLLNGIASVARLDKSLKFLCLHGFLRRTLGGRLVVDETVITSADGLPDAKIRDFHQHALRLASGNISSVPLSRRYEAAVVMHLNDESIDELKDLLRQFYEKLLQFAEERPDQDQGLYQVLFNMTSISNRTETP